MLLQTRKPDWSLLLESIVQATILCGLLLQILQMS